MEVDELQSDGEKVRIHGHSSCSSSMVALRAIFTAFFGVIFTALSFMCVEAERTRKIGNRRRW